MDVILRDFQQTHEHFNHIEFSIMRDFPAARHCSWELDRPDGPVSCLETQPDCMKWTGKTPTHLSPADYRRLMRFKWKVTSICDKVCWHLEIRFALLAEALSGNKRFWAFLAKTGRTHPEGNNECAPLCILYSREVSNRNTLSEDTSSFISLWNWFAVCLCNHIAPGQRSSDINCCNQTLKFYLGQVRHGTWSTVHC